MNEIIQTIAVYALPVIFAITLHEAAHAYAAKYFGDATAYVQGRMSLNPMRHIDPFGTIVIPLILYVATSGAFLFGYAKPVPVEWRNLRNPKRDMAWVALAGPAMNFFQALLWMVFAITLSATNVNEPFLTGMARAGILSNLVMFAFNLFPVPPLDGGRILTSLLPNRAAYKFAQIEPYGFFIVMGLVMLNVLSFWMMPVMLAAQSALSLLVSPLNFLFR
ncbi:Zn-dependent protease (includes SpoIVFB) [Noviherbaspirillum humi]|uniref:Zn-dependent protease (Includes SpoIVFB) n=1 Tax=Noviherbaspirillum humi TaxID=1688639 RepID=A0A239D9I3_9BURK|nr:site-2 protease family protein [Noviherbaspirillum humi]SNS29126.1 Zn-dependent protease (includes SpoIVFB) [Noviherbaspirillum humi]